MSEWKFQRDAIQTFRFVRCTLDAATGVARLVYAFDDGPELVETITAPGAPFELEGERAAAVERALQLLHLIAGVSYYKAAAPERIAIESYAIDADTAALLELIYVNGLGEFAYRNGLNLHGKIRFPHSLPSPPGRGAGGEGALRGSEMNGGRSTRSQRAPTVEASTNLYSSAEPSPRPPLRAPARASGAGAPPHARQWRASSAPSPRGERGFKAPALNLRHHALTAIGGGKDSLVSIEALRTLGVEQTVAWIGGSQLIRACAERTGLPTLNIGRALAPQLFDYNREGAWNGHIPVTVVNSAILVLTALLHSADQVVFSNEHSASYGSMIEGAGEVNHQWSKGWACESAFGDYVQQHIAADLQYYSLLRPLSELAVARQFTRSDRFDAHFSSCNRNFHILGERPANRWCGVCPKCHFVFLALAPFMSKPRLVGIFGRNLLDDPAQVAGFDALLEYQNHKPFECVGEGRESRAAMAALAQRPEWREDALVKRFAHEILPQLDVDQLRIEPLLVLDDVQRIPPQLRDRVRAYFTA